MVAEIPKEPKSREEQYLAKIAGQNIPLPADGPRSREEQYLAKIAGQNDELPSDGPRNRIEMYLNAIVENGGGGGGGQTESKYGRLWLYSWQFNFIENEGLRDNCEIVNIDQDQIKEWAVNNYVSFFDPEYAQEIYFVYDPISEEWAADLGYTQATYTTEGLESEVGVTVSIIDPAESAQFSIFYKGVTDTTSNLMMLELSDNAMVQALANTVGDLAKFGSFVAPTTAIKKFEFGTETASVGRNFLAGCTNLTEVDLQYAKSLSSIGNGFLHYCDSLTALNIQSIPASVFSSSDPQDATLSTDNADAPCYVTGITLTGTYVDDWITLLPNMSTIYYRKLIKGN